MTADSAKTFDLLFDMLKGYFQGLIDSTLKIVGFFLLATGWLVASDKAREVFDDDSTGRVVALVAVFSAWVFVAAATWRVRALSDRTYVLLVELQYMDEKYFDNYRVTRRTLMLHVSGLFALALFLGMLIVRSSTNGVGLPELVPFAAAVTLYVLGSIVLYRTPVSRAAVVDGGAPQSAGDSPHSARSVTGGA